VTLTQYYTATSLDGFIADPDNSLEWLFTRAREPGAGRRFRPGQVLGRPAMSLCGTAGL